MLIKQTEEMSLAERLAAENSNNQFLQALSFVAVGTIFPYAGATPPDTYLLCDGAALDTAAYPELFDVIGYTFGGENEAFNLPDLRGRVLVGVDPDDTDFAKVGLIGGKKTHQLTAEEMPRHTHSIYSKAGEVEAYYITPTGAGADISSFSYVSAAGGSAPHNNMQPYLVGNYIIKATQAITDSDFRFPIDQVYDSKSPNAQSGVALGPLFAGKQTVFADFQQTDADEYTLDLGAIAGANRFKIKYGVNEYLLFSQGEIVIAGENIIFFSAASGYSFGHSRLKSVAAPEEDTDAATKEYVDEAIGKALEGDY